MAKTENPKTENAEKKEPLYLVDGSSFIFRAYYALPPLTNPQGIPVNAVMGFSNMLTKLLTDQNAHSLAVIFDSKRENFRNDIYADYKANRSDPPEDLVPQFGLIRDAVRAFNLPCIELEGYEADDIIATYARLAQQEGREVIIVSSDKDLMQLIDENTTMLDTMKNRQFGIDDVIEKFGVPPEKVVDVQALSGDSIDNVPGVPGIGGKTAALLINEYGDLETLLERAEEIKQNKRRENLIEFADMARISKKLVALEENAPVPMSLDELDLHLPDHDTLIAFLKEQGFKTTLARIENRLWNHAQQQNGNSGQQDQKKDPVYTTVETEEALQQWIDEAYDKKILAIDTETTGLTPAKADLVGISLCITPGTACYIPLGHTQDAGFDSFDFSEKTTDKENGKENDEGKTYQQIPMQKAIAMLKPLLEDPAVLKIGHNIKYDLQMLMHHGIHMSPVDDTMLLSYVLDNTLHGHGMDELAELFLDKQTIKFKEIAGTGKNQKRFDEISIAVASPYAAEDADITRQLHDLFKPRLAEEKATTLYEKVERPLIPVIAEMEFTGIKVDPTILKKMSNDFAIKLADLEKEIHEQAGTSFNIASPKQLGEVLFDQMGLPSGKKSKTGAWSTSMSILEPLANDHKIVKDVLEYRGLAKLKSTYTDALQEQINPKTGRVHTSFVMAGTSTGRLASSDPNLQNIPIRSEEGRKIRTAFITEPGWKIVAIDYSQVELRLAAEIANVPSLKKAFLDGVDIHTHTAAQVFGLPLEDVTPDQRRQAKAINFGIIYGISGWGLAKQLGVEADEAKAYIDQYLGRFPELKQYMDDQKEKAKKHGYVETIMGRKCMISGINDKNFSVRGFAERQAINAPLQGSNADIIKKAMVRVQKAINKNSWDARLLLQVHDELIFEIKEDVLDSVVPELKKIMESIVKLSIPLIADDGIGDNWSEAH